MRPPDGTTIINVADPKNPKIVWQCKTDNDKSHTHKVRVAGDIMITNVEQNNRQRPAGGIPDSGNKSHAWGGGQGSDR